MPFTLFPSSIVILLPLVFFGIMRFTFSFLFPVIGFVFFLSNIELVFAIRNVLHALGGENLLHEGLTQFDLVQNGSGTWDRDAVLGGKCMKEELDRVSLPLWHGCSDMLCHLLQKYGFELAGDW